MNPSVIQEYEGVANLLISLKPSLFNGCSHLRYIHTCTERMRAGAGGKLASTQNITCVHTYAVAEWRWSGSKIRSATNGSNTQFFLRNRMLQTIFVLKKWQIRPRPLRVCVNIPAVAERECQNPQRPSAYVNVALCMWCVWLLLPCSHIVVGKADCWLLMAYLLSGHP